MGMKLPLASATVDGILNNVSQSLAGMKTITTTGSDALRLVVDDGFGLRVATSNVAGQRPFLSIWGARTSDGVVGSLEFVNQGPGAATVAQIYANRSGANNSGQMVFETRNVGNAVVSATVAPDGAWTFGPATGISTNYHTYNGSIRLKIAALEHGSVGSATILELGTNVYQDSTGGVRAHITATGYVQLRINRVTSVDSNAWVLATNATDAQTAGAAVVSTNEVTAMTVDAGGLTSLKGVKYFHQNRAMVGGGTENALNVSKVSCIRFDSGTAGTYTINGFSGGVVGQVVYLMKVTANSDPLVITHNSGSATQKIFTKSGSNISITGIGSRAFIFDNDQWNEL